MPSAEGGLFMQLLHWLALFFIYLIFFLGADIYQDVQAHSTFYHLLWEVSGTFISLLGAGLIIYHFISKHNALKSTFNDLRHSETRLAQLDMRYQELAKDFSNTINQQFEDWQLSPSEKEVARLLLKGLSLAEIAEVRETQEKTVRQQASKVYQKSGISGRHALAAFFLEDLLVPAEPIATSQEKTS
jgi:DNA-binding CsgD family transcriptional regulator